MRLLTARYYLEKLAFNLADAKSALKAAKPKVLKVPRVNQARKALSQAAQRGATAMPKGVSMAQASLAYGGGAPVAVSRRAVRDTSRAVSAGHIAKGAVNPVQQQGMGQLQGRVLQARGGDATRQIANHPGVSRETRQMAHALTPEQRLMHNAAVKGHEMQELRAKGSGVDSWKLMTGHQNPQPPLIDSNVAATLSPEHKPVGDLMRSYRPTEASYLERATRRVGGQPGVGFGEMRLSRHARKRVGARMKEFATDDMRGALKRQMVRAQLNSQGIQGIHGIGKIGHRLMSVAEFMGVV